MFILTFVRPNDLVASLNISGSFYDITIIKQNNMVYQHKVIFYIRDGFGYGFGVGYLYTRYPSHTLVLKSGKTQTHTRTQSKRGKPVKLGLVRVGNHVYGFCCHAYSHRPDFHLCSPLQRDLSGEVAQISLATFLSSFKTAENH